ncbi:hypothetical protein ACFX13_007825 [Malus domestica]
MLQSQAISTLFWRWSLIPLGVQGQRWRIQTSDTWGLTSTLSSTTKPWNSGGVEGKLNRVWISYNSNSKNLSVSLTTYANDNRKQVITLSFLVDLSKYLPVGSLSGFLLQQVQLLLCSPPGILLLLHW